MAVPELFQMHTVNVPRAFEALFVEAVLPEKEIKKRTDKGQEEYDQ